MISLSAPSNSQQTAVPGPMVHPDSEPGLCTPTHSPNKLWQLIDERRELAAKLAGKELEIAMSLGDMEGAQRARRDMEAQTIARRAAREAGCYFLWRGEADRAALNGAPAHG